MGVAHSHHIRHPSLSPIYSRRWVAGWVPQYPCHHVTRPDPIPIGGEPRTRPPIFPLTTDHASMTMEVRYPTLNSPYVPLSSITGLARYDYGLRFRAPLPVTLNVLLALVVVDPSAMDPSWTQQVP